MVHITNKITTTTTTDNTTTTAIVAAAATATNKEYSFKWATNSRYNEALQMSEHIIHRVIGNNSYILRWQ